MGTTLTHANTHPAVQVAMVSIRVTMEAVTAATVVTTQPEVPIHRSLLVTACTVALRITGKMLIYF